MFFLIRRTLITLFWCFWACVAFYLYQQRARFEPAIDYATLWRNRDRNAPQEFPRLAGHVTRVLDSESVQLRTGHSDLWVFGFTGLAIPRATALSTPEQKQLATDARDLLARWLEDQDAIVRVTFQTEQRTGLGIFLVGDTNANLGLVAHGLAAVRPDYLRSLPVREQFELVQAEKQARRRGLGIWKHPPTP